MQIKASGRYHFTLIKVVITVETLTSVDKDIEKWNSHILLGEIQNRRGTLQNSLVAPQKIKHRVSI